MICMPGHASAILLYHNITDEPSSAMAPFTVTPKTFAEHMRLVAESGLPVLNAGQYAKERAARECVVVTFDDGFVDFHSSALPILQRFGISASLFVTTGWMEDAPPSQRKCGPADRMLHLRDLPSLAAEGVEIGSHSVTHPQMDTMGPHGADLELSCSKTILQQALGAQVESFAYPHGFQSPRLRRQAHEAGYTCAYGVGNALASSTSSQMNIPRLMAGPATSAEVVAAWLRRTDTPVLGDRDRLRTQVFRLVRRSKARAKGDVLSDWT